MRALSAHAAVIALGFAARVGGGGLKLLWRRG